MLRVLARWHYSEKPCGSIKWSQCHCGRASLHSSDFIFEVKWGGFRALAVLEHGLLGTATGLRFAGEKLISARLPDTTAVIDGETGRRTGLKLPSGNLHQLQDALRCAPTQKQVPPREFVVCLGISAVSLPGPASQSSRGLSLADHFLLLADLRSGLGDAAFYEISLNLELLQRA